MKHSYPVDTQMTYSGRKPTPASRLRVRINGGGIRQAPACLSATIFDRQKNKFAKVKRNAARDKANLANIASDGWRSLVIWKCQLKDTAALASACGGSWENSMVKVDVDFAWNEHLQEVLQSIRKHGGKILDFVPVGPGGGNPNVLLQFPNEQSGLAFLVERYPDDGREFNLSRLEMA